MGILAAAGESDKYCAIEPSDEVPGRGWLSISSLCDVGIFGAELPSDKYPPTATLSCCARDLDGGSYGIETGKIWSSVQPCRGVFKQSSVFRHHSEDVAFGGQMTSSIPKTQEAHGFFRKILIGAML